LSASRKFSSDMVRNLLSYLVQDRADYSKQPPDIFCIMRPAGIL